MPIASWITAEIERDYPLDQVLAMYKMKGGNLQGRGSRAMRSAIYRMSAASTVRGMEGLQ